MRFTIPQKESVVLIRERRPVRCSHPLYLLLTTAYFSLTLTDSAAVARTSNPGDTDDFAGRPRVLVLSDMGNEPDDQMSFVRLLLYSNELDLEGLIATTSTWQKKRVQPEIMRKLVAVYGEV